MSNKIPIADLDESLIRLVDAARVAADSSYSPYSRFPVGAAVMSDDGTIFTGCNIENASFGLTMCAERVALGNAIAAGKRRLSAFAVYTATSEPTTPCGACRQVIAEHSLDALVVCTHNSAIASVNSVRELLPESFGPKNGATHLGKYNQCDE